LFPLNKLLQNKQIKNVVNNKVTNIEPVRLNIAKQKTEKLSKFKKLGKIRNLNKNKINKKGITNVNTLAGLEAIGLIMNTVVSLQIQIGNLESQIMSQSISETIRIRLRIEKEKLQRQLQEEHRKMLNSNNPYSKPKLN
jgi:hypothetical protein